MRRSLLIILCLLPCAGIIGSASESQALPIIGEFYAGAGARSTGLYGDPGTAYAFGLEAGWDHVFREFGLGFRLDLPHADPHLTTELRYSLIAWPFLRIVGGVAAGVARQPNGSPQWDKVLSGFIGGRVSLGLPYVSCYLGESLRDDAFSPYMTLSVGFAL